jgi:hypothetical protein
MPKPWQMSAQTLCPLGSPKDPTGPIYPASSVAATQHYPAEPEGCQNPVPSRRCEVVLVDKPAESLAASDLAYGRLRF